MSYLNAIGKARIDILKDNEEPRDILISVNLRHAILDEIGPYYRCEGLEHETLMGMNVEWTKPVALTKPQIAIRTAAGDMRIVSMFDAASREVQK